MMHKRDRKADKIHQKFGQGVTSQKSAVEGDKIIFVSNWAHNIFGVMRTLKILATESQTVSSCLVPFRAL